MFENIYPCPPVTQPPPAVKLESLEIPLPPFQQQYSSEVAKPKDEIKTESSQVGFTLMLEQLRVAQNKGTYLGISLTFHTIRILFFL